MSTVFLSHSGRDRSLTEDVAAALRARGIEALFVDFDPEQGIPAGRRWEGELYSRLRQADAVVVVLSAAAAASAWCFAEISLARSLGRPVLPLRTTPGVDLPLLSDVQWTDLADESWPDRLVAGLHEAGVGPDAALAWDHRRSPYPGLGAFAPEDAAVFFAREDEIRRVVELVHPTLRREHGAVVAVAGPSGSGKSSLVAAGLVARLRREPGRWAVLPVVIPGRAPVHELARSLAAALGREPHQVHAELEDAPDRVAAFADEIADEARADRGGRRPDLLLVVDQAEELLTRAGIDEQRRFLDLVRRLGTAEAGVWVVVTVRPEFLSGTPERAGLAEMVDETVMIEAVGRERLADVIVRPARRAGLEFDDGLVERMVGDTAGGDALPLLAHTLRELADRVGPDGRVTRESYAALGGVVGALEHRADRVAAELARAGHGDAVLPTLLRFVHLEREDEASGRPVDPDELDAEGRIVVDAFVEARLLTAHREGPGPGTVRVAHEALLRRWTPLRDAVEADRESLRLRSEIERLAVEWERSGREESYLLSGTRLAAVEQWIAGRTVLGRTVEDAFVAASRARHTRQLDDARRSNQRLRRLVAGLAALLVLALVAAGIAAVTTREAQEESDVASSRLFAARASTIEQTDPDTAILDGLQSLSLGRTRRPEAPAGLVAGMGEVTHTSRILRPGGGAAEAVAFSPDGRLFATAGDGSQARIWDTATGAPHGLPLAGHTNSLFSVAFSPDGRLLATASVDHTVRLWDVATGTPHGGPLRGHTSQVTDVAFSPDGRLLASASADKTVRLWDVATGEPHAPPLTGNASFVLAVAFSPDGGTLASAGGDNTVRLWDVATGTPRGAPLAGHTGQVYDVAFSPDGRTLASVSYDHTVRLWDPVTGAPRGPVATVPDVYLLGMAFSPNGRTLAVGCGDSIVRTWDTGTWSEEDLYRGHTSQVNGVAFNPDGRTLASASTDGTVRLWDRADHASVSRVLIGHSDATTAVAFSRDGRLVASASWDHTVRFWDAATGRPVGSPLVGHTDRVNGVAFSPDGTLVASAGDDGTVRVWDVASGRPKGPPLTGTAGFYAVAFSPDGRLLATGGTDYAVRLWDVGTRQPHGPALNGHLNSVFAIVFSPDGRQLASGSVDRTARLWDVATGAPVGDPIVDFTGSVTGVAFSPDGRVLATSSGDGTVSTWDTATRRRHGPPFTGHGSPVSGVAFAPDGATLASAGNDRTVLLSDVNTGTARGPVLEGHTNLVNSVAFSPDGRTVASSGGDNDVRLWRPAFHNWLHDGCALVNRNLSMTEWNQVAPDLPYERTCPTLPPGEGAPADAPLAQYG